jgi:predicted translin family RNA/ssDNA-binding protein
MINKQDFKKIREKLSRYDSNREKLIKKARDVLKLSKQLIYTIHRKNLKEAKELVDELNKEKKILDKIASSDKKLFYEGSYSQAMQEYVEALTYYGFIKNGKIPILSALKVNEQDYLMGICDLTGELGRKAVTIAHKSPKEVEKIKNLVEEIFGEFIKFDLRNGNLRKKADSIKWNLKKLEEVMYDVKKKK